MITARNFFNGKKPISVGLKIWRECKDYTLKDIEPLLKRLPRNVVSSKDFDVTEDMAYLSQNFENLKFVKSQFLRKKSGVFEWPCLGLELYDCSAADNTQMLLPNCTKLTMVKSPIRFIDFKSMKVLRDLTLDISDLKPISLT